MTTEPSPDISAEIKAILMMLSKDGKASPMDNEAFLVSSLALVERVFQDIHMIAGSLHQAVVALEDIAISQRIIAGCKLTP